MILLYTVAGKLGEIGTVDKSEVSFHCYHPFTEAPDYFKKLCAVGQEPEKRTKEQNETYEGFSDLDKEAVQYIWCHWVEEGAHVQTEDYSNYLNLELNMFPSNECKPMSVIS